LRLIVKKNLLLLRLLLLCLALYTDGVVQAYAVRLLQSDVGNSASNTQASLFQYFSHHRNNFQETGEKTADSRSALAQGLGRCLSNDDVKKMLAQLNSNQNVALNKKLRDELLKLKERNQQKLDDDIRDNRKPDELIKRIRATREKNNVQLCSILKQNGWPTKSLVDKDGVDAAIFAINSSSAQLRVDLMPVIIAATRQGEISRPDFAGYVDRLRIDSGLKQIFGTQATILDGFLVLFPIEAEQHVDSRRKQYELGPLALYIRFLESQYRLPLIKSTGALTNKFSDSARSSVARTTSADLLEGQTLAEDEVVRTDTNLVSFNVSVFSKQLRTQVTTLTQNDFSVSEDGQAQEITYFAATDAPFDLVLLIDLSGSTSNKRKLIRKSTQRFIEAARPSDRLAIVTFSDAPNVISPLTNDRAKLLESLSGINEDVGSSHVWDALKFTLDHVVGEKSLERRRAVVFMTDGVDNALDNYDAGSETNFSDLLEAVRSNAALIIPIYLDTEGDEYSSRYMKRVFENARKTLTRMADESGGLYYQAKKIEDLEGVYGQVIADLGKVYSLGYKPTNEKRDHTWRTVKIQLPNLPDLITRARPGYYAN
jgi:VWFA-related protein